MTDGVICPYCLGEAMPSASACRHCGRDLIVFAALDARLRALEVAQKRLDDALKTRSAPDQGTTAAQEVVHVAEPHRPTWWSVTIGDRPSGSTIGRIAVHVVLALLLLVAGQLVTVFVFDASFGALVAVLVAASVMAGLRCSRVLGDARVPALVVSIVVAVAATFAMSLPISIVDHTEFLPSYEAVWRQNAKAVLAIGLAHFAASQYSWGLARRILLMARTHGGATTSGLADPGASVKLLAQRFKNWTDAGVIVVSTLVALWAALTNHRN